MEVSTENHRFHMVLLLRWLLIAATAYLVVFSRPLSQLPPTVGLFIVLYLGSNLLLPLIAPRFGTTQALDIIVVLFDVLAISIGLSLCRDSSADFFPVYFLVVFVGALSERLGIAVGAAVLISVIHLSTLARFMTVREMVDHGYALRIPFLFTVSLFLSFVVARARARERAARRRQRQRRRAEVLSAITHDIKSPLANVQSMCEILIDGEAGRLTSAQANFVRRIHASVRHVIQLSVNLLDAARIDAGRFSLYPRIANIGGVVDSAVSLMRNAAVVKGVGLKYQRCNELPLSVFDALQMERVITNLIDNAIKYTPVGGTVTVTTRADDSRAVIEVSDTGPGIAPEEIPGLFERFERRRQSGAIEGSGLGLFIVKAIVDAHNGYIEMQSAPGCGTTVCVRLARIQRDLPATAPAEVAVPATALAWRPYVVSSR
ncbi:MAG: HAMP domain-containing histidine kinase [Deltaproteobacteria bacterium]|nr:HAMP domain-containing histidine kinase [Deltaproteobacteria bacterium]